MPDIWITQYRPEFDFTPAVEWGKVRIVTEVEVPRIYTGPEWELFKFDVSKFLTAFNPADDFLLFAGNPYQMMVIAIELSKKFRNPVKTLKWMKRERKYVVVSMPLHMDKSQ